MYLGCLAVMWLLLLLLPGSLGNPQWTGTHLSGWEWTGRHKDRYERTGKSVGGVGPWVQVRRFVVPRYVGVGVNVSLECEYVVQQDATLYSLKWYKGNSQFYQYIPSKTQPQAVFTVTGLHRNQLAGGSDGRKVTIFGVGVDASDVYRCELVAEGPPFHTTQRSANMTVAVVPDGSPSIKGSQTHYQVNQWLDLNCTAPPARPAPTLTWLVNGHQVDSSSVWEMDPTVTESGLERARSNLSFRVGHHHFHGGGLKIKCEARLSSLYIRSHQVIIPHPSTTWFSTLSLYHSSGCAITSSSSLVLVLLALRHLLP